MAISKVLLASTHLWGGGYTEDSPLSVATHKRITVRECSERGSDSRPSAREDWETGDLP